VDLCAVTLQLPHDHIQQDLEVGLVEHLLLVRDQALDHKQVVEDPLGLGLPVYRLQQQFAKVPALLVHQRHEQDLLAHFLLVGGIELAEQVHQQFGHFLLLQFVYHFEYCHHQPQLGLAPLTAFSYSFPVAQAGNVLLRGIQLV
jgi:hypothetical protein